MVKRSFSIYLNLTDLVNKKENAGKKIYFLQLNARNEEAIKATMMLYLGKQVLDPGDEKLFYYPIFQGRNEQTLKTL